MGDFVKPLFDVLPAPFIAAAAVFVLAAWMVREYRGYDTNGPLFRDKWVYGVLVVCAFCPCAYYTYSWMADDVKFSTRELGVYVDSFMNDPQFEVPSEIEAIVASTLDKQRLPNVRVFVSRKYPPHASQDLYEVGEARNAALVISGAKFRTGETWIRITNLSRRSEKTFKSRLEPAALGETIQTDLLEMLGEREPGVSQNARNTAQTDAVMAAVSTLKFQLDEALKRLGDLESSQKIASSARPRPLTVLSKAGRRLALLVGISKYGANQPSSTLPPLRYPVDDVRDVESRLVSGNYERAAIRTLVDSSATKASIRDSFRRLQQTAAPEDSLFVYFSGHSIVEKSSNGQDMGYLLPVDYAVGATESTGISATELREWVSQIPAKQVSVLIDGCYSASFGKADGEIRSRSLSVAPPSLNLVPPSPKLWSGVGDKVLIVLAGASRTQEAIEGPGWNHGLFTYHVLDGLSGGADLNRDSEIAADELYAYVYPKVVKDSLGRQTPVLDAVGTAAVSIVRLPPTSSSQSSPAPIGRTRTNER